MHVGGLPMAMSTHAAKSGLGGRREVCWVAGRPVIIDVWIRRLEKHWL